MRKLLFLSLIALNAYPESLFVHSFVHCGNRAKTRKILLYNAFTNRTLCEGEQLAYPASEIECVESSELIDKCRQPIECKAKFTCTPITETTNRRRMVKMVRDDESIPMFQKVNPFATLTESQEQKQMIEDNKSPASESNQ